MATEDCYCCSSKPSITPHRHPHICHSHDFTLLNQPSPLSLCVSDINIVTFIQLTVALLASFATFISGGAHIRYCSIAGCHCCHWHRPIWGERIISLRILELRLNGQLLCRFLACKNELDLYRDPHWEIKYRREYTNDSLIYELVPFLDVPTHYWVDFVPKVTANLLQTRTN